MQKYKNVAIASFQWSGEPCIPDGTGSGTTCNGAPRSAYKDVPWGVIDVKNSYKRLSSYDITRTPYMDWK